VHVWAPAPAHSEGAVTVHELGAAYRASALHALDEALDRCPPPRRLFVQWVPHGYGYKSLNVPFCLWVRKRARRGDEVYLMVHEPFLAFDRHRVRQNVGAVVHRVMLRLLLKAASRVWVSTPSFLDDVRRFGPRESLDVRWLPIPSPVTPVHDPAAVEKLRNRLAGELPLVGYFGTCNSLVAPLLQSVFEQMASRQTSLRVALMGRGTRTFADRLVAAGRIGPAAIVASGEQPAYELSLLLQCCDVFIQPYPDGVSSRRTTLMALLEHGCAVVASAGPRTEEGWRESDVIVLTSQGDAPAMAAAALRLLDEPAKRRSMRDRARTAYITQFDVGHALDVLIDGVAV
jgi:glycosyltransferase involved in cell wall biosynthesis